MEVKEFEIPVPWGQVSVKSWGNETHPPILTVHGVLDNAGTFDRLIPLLHSTFNYICIDLPGHGKSSHFPPHLPIHTMDYILVYTLVTEYLKKDKFTIMGHSYGGMIGFLFAQLYPHKVEKLIMLDTVHMFPVSVKHFRDYVVDKYDTHLSIQEKLANRRAPVYTYEAALERLIRGRDYFLKKEAAEALIKRSLVPVGDGKFRFSQDQRLKNFINPIHDFDYAIETLKKYPVNCPVIIFFGNDSSAQQMFMKRIINFLKKQKNVRIKMIAGNHDLHNNDPDLVAPYINKFLANQNSKL